MQLILILSGLVIGFILGLVAAFVLRIIHSKTAKELLDEFKRESEVQKDMNVKELENKKGLIDLQLSNMTSKLEDVSKLVKELEKDRERKFGELTTHLETTSKQTSDLIKTTGTLSKALASSKVRGQWGERMAEDVLRLAGFVENTNYIKQKVIEGVGNKPDFTFFLPRDLKLNMDVKFPYDNYVRFLEAESDSDKETYRKNFLKDVKTKIKDIANRDYINPEQNTVDCVLLFIPNEQIYTFINEQDISILDEGIHKRVIMCSPSNIFAILAVIRQAVENFKLEQASNEILSLFGRIKKQWDMFIKSHDKLGKRIQDALDDYNILKSTRRNALEKPLNKIEEIRTQRKIPIDTSNLPEIEEEN